LSVKVLHISTNIGVQMDKLAYSLLFGRLIYANIG